MLIGQHDCGAIEIKLCVPDAAAWLNQSKHFFRTENLTVEMNSLRRIVYMQIGENFVDCHGLLRVCW
jgi:hypothetical protein